MSEDIGYAVTVTLPGRYFTADLYVVVPSGVVAEPDGWARRLAACRLDELARYVPEARLEITSIRRVI